MNNNEAKEYNVEVDVLLMQAKIALNEKNWDRANDCFTKVISIDSENGDAYIGKEYCINHVKNFDELMSRRREGLQNIKSTTIFGANINSDTLEYSIQRFCKSGLFNAKEIKKEYDFNREFDSLVAGATELLNSEKMYWNSNKNILMAIKYSSKDISEKIISQRNSFICELENKLEEEKLKDINKSETIEKTYESLTQKTLQIEYENRAETLYQKNCNLFNLINADTPKSEMKDLIADFERIYDYKDSKKYIEKLTKTIETLRNEKIRIFGSVFAFIFIVALILIISNLVSHC